MMLMKRNRNILILICSNKVQKSGISVMIDIDGGARWAVALTLEGGGRPTN